MLDQTYGAIADVVRKAIAGISIDNTIIRSKVAPEDQETVSSVIKAVSLVCCNLPISPGGVGAPFNIETMKSSGHEREYAIGIAVAGTMISVTRLVDMIRSCHPNILDVFFNIDLAHQKNPVTISVHMSCGPRNIIDVIYHYSARPRGNYTNALMSSLEFATSEAQELNTNATPGSAAANVNGHPPPFKKRKRSSSDNAMSD